MKHLISLCLVLFSGFVQAQIQFKDITYRGTGCPAGTVSTVVSPDGSSLSVLFDEFRAEVPQFDGNNDNTNDEVPPRGPRARNRNTPTLSFKNCALSFTTDLPPGSRAEALEINLQARGATLFDPEVEGFFTAVLVGHNGLSRSRGQPTIVIQKHWRAGVSGVEDNWTASPRAVVPLHSGCSGSQGRTIRFDMKNSIKAEIITQNQNRHGLISVDSADMTGLLKFTLRIRPCGGDKLSPLRPPIRR